MSSIHKNIHTAHSGQNVLLIRAKPLLCFIAQISLSPPSIHPNTLHSLLIHEIRLYQNALQSEGVDELIQIASSYCLCTAIDEAVMNRHIDSEMNWSKQSLLSLIHNETWGGERFYSILSHALNHPNEFYLLIELMYVLLRLGYRGKYHDSPRYYIDSIKDQSLKSIVLHRNSPEQLDKNHDYILNDAPKISLLKLKKLTRSLGIFGLIASLSYAVIGNYQLSKISKPYLISLQEKVE